MTAFAVSYRGEFGSVIEAENEKEATEKFENGNCDIVVLSALHPEYFECTKED